MTEFDKKILDDGTIKLEGSCVLSDPFYNPGTWCHAALTDIKSGTWNCCHMSEHIVSGISGKQYDMGERVAWMLAAHESLRDTDIKDITENMFPLAYAPEHFILPESNTEQKLCLGVDSAMFSIQTPESFARNAEDEDFLEKIESVMSKEQAMTKDGMFATETGLGDGSYDAYILTDENDNDNVSAILVRFL